MLHETLAKGKWFTLSLAKQLGNVGSEFDRVLAAVRRHDGVRLVSAEARFYELMDLTITDPRWQGLRRRELARLREMASETFADSRSSEAESLQKYFLQFGILARSEK